MEVVLKIDNTDVPMNKPLPSLALINDFATHLRKQGLDTMLFTQADTRAVRDVLPEIAVFSVSSVQNKPSSVRSVG